MPWPIVSVPSGGIRVTESPRGAPAKIAANGRGTAVTFVASGGLPLSSGGGVVDIVSADGEIYSRTYKTGAGQPFGVPSNGWYYVNNDFGRGSLVNGVDFTMTMKAVQASFPNNALIEWNFGAGGGSGIGAFAYGYPGIIFVSTPYGDADGPFNESGKGYPRKIKNTTVFKIAYNVTHGGNLQSYNGLIDAYVTTAPDSSDGSSLLEISFFPHANTNLPFVGSDTHTFVSVGKCRVGLQGQQACFYPCSPDGASHRDIEVGEVDMLEIALYCVARGWVTDEGYLRGFEFGCEVQVPAAFNTGPYNGSVKFNSIPVVQMATADGTPLVAPSLLSAPTITGTAVEGSVLSGADAVWLASPAVSRAYQWYANGVAISGATSLNFTLTASENGKSVIRRETATNSSGTASADTAAVVPSAAVAPTNSVAPVVTNPSVQQGYVVQGQVLSISNGTWAGNPAPIYAYRWKADGSVISGQTASSYTVQAGDDAKVITGEVQATNVAGSSAWVAASLAPVAIAGTLRLNESFVSGQGTWQASGGYVYTSGASGKLTMTNASAFSGVGRPIAGMTAGKTARIISDRVTSAGNNVMRATGATNPGGTLRATGTWTANIDNVTIPASPTGIDIQCQAITSGTLDNILVVELP